MRLANIRARLGLDRPAYVRYFHWLGGLFTGDLGTSLSSGYNIASFITLDPMFANMLGYTQAEIASFKDQGVFD